MSTIGGPANLVGIADGTASKQKKKRIKKKKAAKEGIDNPTATPINTAPPSSNAKVTKKKVEAYVSSEEEDYSDDEDEGKKGYRPGGYHPVAVGDIFKNRYLTLEKLGWGHFSTVWLCRDATNNKLVALKVVKSAKHYTSAALDEIKILKTISNNDPEGKVQCLHLVDSFDHRGPNGKHVCMVFQLLGSNLLELIKRYNYRGIPMKMVKHIIYDVLTALDYLHTTCHVIHTDLKPENVLLEFVLPKLVTLPSSRQTQPEKSSDDEFEADFEEGEKGHEKKKARKKKENSSEENKESIKFKDLSLSSEGKEEKKDEKTSKRREKSRETSRENSRENINYNRRSHESVEEDLPNKERESLDYPPAKAESSFLNTVEIKEEDPSTYKSYLVDLGNACWVKEHFTDEIQTRQYRAPEVIIGAKYGPSVDMWSVGCLAFELLTGDLLFEPKDGTNYDKDDDHLAQMIEVLGEIPKKFALSGKNSRHHFNAAGELRFIKKLTMWGLTEVFEQKYHFNVEDSKETSSFMKAIMEFNPERRATAAQMLKHNWLKEVVEYREKLNSISNPSQEGANQMKQEEK